MKLRLISLMVAAAFAAPFATAATPAADTDAARKAELAKARAELAESARRVAELSRGMDGETHEFRFETDFAGPPRVGIGIVMGTVEKGGGVRISAVSPEGPAAKAGLRAGDILTAVDGQAVAGTDEAAVQSARKLLADLEKGDLVRIGYTRAGKGGLASVTAAPIDRVMRFSTTDFPRGADFPRGTLVLPRTAPLVSPGVEMEIARIAAAPCADGDGDCKVPVLAHAFRWNGLNLASVDAKLGRYFGTDRGVLVLSGGDALAALEPGDVIQKIDGAAVATPRDAMRALGEQDAGDRVDVVVLRDRKTRTVAVTVPEAAPLRWFTPPPPPAPPAPPAPPGMTAPPAPPAPPSPPDTPAPPAPPAGAGTAMFFLEAPPAPSSDATWTDENGQVLRIVSQQRTAGEGDGEVVERIVVSTAGTPAD